MSFDRPATKPPQVPALASPTAKLPSPKNRLTPPGPVSTQQSPSSRPASEPSKREKVEGIYKQLSHAAVDLNGASDELGKPIQVWEAALKKLNLGVSAWVELSSGGDDRERWWDRGVGYTKLKDRWGIALRTREGSHQSPDDDSEELWPFSEAPRWMRIEGVGKLPDLLEALLKQAGDTTKKIRAKIEQANELAEAISNVADDMAASAEGR